MSGSWIIRYCAEFFGTAILVLFGNGAVANSFLKKTTANGKDGQANGGWLYIAFAWGFGVMLPAFMFFNISGNHINPAITIAEACAGIFPWTHVIQYIVAQLLGAIVGQLLVVAIYWPYFKETPDNPTAILSSFATGETLGKTMNGFWAELISTGILMFAAMGFYHHMPFSGGTGFADIGVGLVITALVMGCGGPTGPSMNPARDLGPRIVHAILPIPNKGDSNWGYAWVPVVATTLGAIIAILIYKAIFGL